MYSFINFNVAQGSTIYMDRSFDIFFTRVTEATEIGSLAQLAELLQVNRSAITQARKKGSVPAAWKLRLFKKLGLNPDWLEGGAGPPIIKPGLDGADDFHSVPKVQARLCAGGGSFEMDPHVKGYYSFKKEWLSRKGVADQMVLMDVFGNSMTPEIKDGDTVLVDQAQKDILAGVIYAVGIDDTIMVKRIEKHPQKLVLLSDNSEHAPIYLSGEEIESVRIIGKVLWICREMR